MAVHYPNIEKALKIEVEYDKGSGNFRADAKALPGMPIVGIGLTEADAKYSLCVNLLYIMAMSDCRTGGDSGYKPIIANILQEDMERTGRVL